MRVVEFIVWGEPMGKGRPRFTKDGRAYTPAKTQTYEAEVVSAFRRYCPGFIPWEKGVPLKIRIRAVYGIPQSASKTARAKMIAGQTRPTRKPDLDNVEKIIWDSIRSLCFYDDAQIADARCTKEFGEEPRVEVTIKEIAY